MKFFSIDRYHSIISFHFAERAVLIFEYLSQFIPTCAVYAHIITASRRHNLGLKSFCLYLLIPFVFVLFIFEMRKCCPQLDQNKGIFCLLKCEYIINVLMQDDECQPNTFVKAFYIVKGCNNMNFSMISNGTID